jgi:hypothetical protein
MMRDWAGPLGFLGGLLAFVFWLVVPFFTTHTTAVHIGQEGYYIAFMVLAAAGMVGAVLAGGSSRLAPLLMGLAVIPGIAALLLPGLLLIAAALLALQEPGAGRTRPAG